MNGAANGITKAVETIVGQSLAKFPTDRPYTCPICGETVPQKVLPFKNRHGKPVVVQPVCPCEVEREEREALERERAADKREINRKFARGMMGERFREADFSQYIKRLGSEKVHEMALRYVEEYKEWGGRSLLIHGRYGNGKTFLAACVANALDAAGEIVVFLSVPELLHKIRATYNSKSRETEQELMNMLQRADLVVLDDIGAEYINKKSQGEDSGEVTWVADVMYRLIDGRYRANRPVLYTSNLEPIDLEERLGGRIFERILESTVAVQNTATSYRAEKAANKLKQDKKRWHQE